MTYYVSSGTLNPRHSLLKNIKLIIPFVTNKKAYIPRIYVAVTC